MDNGINLADRVQHPIVKLKVAECIEPDILKSWQVNYGLVVDGQGRLNLPPEATGSVSDRATCFDLIARVVGSNYNPACDLSDCREEEP